MLAVLLPIAVLNKESNILIPIFYGAVYWKTFPTRNLATKVAVLTFFAASAFVFGRYLAFGASGGILQYHLPDNLQFLTDPKSWILWFTPYGGLIPFPRGFNIILITPVIIILYQRRSEISSPIFRLLITSLVLNVPLLVCFGFRDEMRNLSLAFIPLYLAILSTAKSTLEWSASHVEGTR